MRLNERRVSECPNLELTEAVSLIGGCLNLINPEKLILPFFEFPAEFFLNAFFLRPRKLNFMEGMLGHVGTFVQRYT